MIPSQKASELELRARFHHRTVANQMAYEAAYDLGYDAKYNQRDDRENKYPEGTAAHEGFDDGYSEACAMA